MNLHLEETIRRNLHKTPEERVETLMAALRETEARDLWPKIDRKAKEQRIIEGLRKSRENK
jgi:flagellar biosynthesis regulator FlbT